jgi:hypothetical protein
MLNILSSPARNPSPHFDEAPRVKREDNVTWLERNLPANGGPVVILLGGTDTYAFRVRVAQSQLRSDLSPSHWSHAALLLGGNGKSLARAALQEIRLDPPHGFASPAPHNALQQGTLGSYRDPDAYPNIAAARLPVETARVKEQLERFQKQRAVLDAPELVLVWLAFVWGAGRAGNPLLDGHGLPSAAMLETVIGGAGYELTPGLDSRASSPEAIWQAAKWWHGYYEKQQQGPLEGVWRVDHRLGPGR